MLLVMGRKVPTKLLSTQSFAPDRVSAPFLRTVPPCPVFGSGGSGRWVDATPRRRNIADCYLSKGPPSRH